MPLRITEDFELLFRCNNLKSSAICLATLSLDASQRYAVDVPPLPLMLLPGLVLSWHSVIIIRFSFTLIMTTEKLVQLFYLIRASILLIHEEFR